MQHQTKSNREGILSAIRRALAVPAPRPGHHEGEAKTQQEPKFHSTLPIMGQEPVSSWLPPVGASWDDWRDLFAANSVDLKTEFIVCADEADLNAHLKRLAEQNGWKKVALHHGELTDKAQAALGLETMWVDKGYDPHELEKCDAGLTQCDALVAQTGSVVMSNPSAGGRVLSVLPPHHVVLARRDQLLPDLPTAFELMQSKYGDNYPSLMGFITGPSRTGDIERILVLGAHGPKKLTVLVV
ncbi:putative protein [Abditibacteriota bacterium]|nr:putative protein [Abditibacteriota bacterium]